jgi:cytochrome c biogenesis protein CcmG/thiol:disulfide interchange protein DsbE
MEEHPVLVQFSRAGVVPIYGLNYKDQREAAQAWLAKNGNPYTTSIADLDGKVGIDYGVYGVPETFLIDKAGVIRYKRIGPVTPKVLNDQIMPLIKQLQAS